MYGLIGTLCLPSGASNFTLDVQHYAEQLCSLKADEEHLQRKASKRNVSSLSRDFRNKIPPTCQMLDESRLKSSGLSWFGHNIVHN